MAEINDDVMSMVRAELEEDPDVENKVLFEKATEIDEAIGDLSLRQFHARYPLQVKRQKAQAKGGRKKKRKSKSSSAKRTGASARSGDGGVDRERIRGTLLEFAKEVTAASGQADMIDLIANVDRYVDEVAKAVDGR